MGPHGVQVEEDVVEDEGRPRAIRGRCAGAQRRLADTARRLTQVVRKAPERGRSIGAGAHAFTFVPAGTVAPSSTTTVVPSVVTLIQLNAVGAGPRTTAPSRAKADP